MALEVRGRLDLHHSPNVGLNPDKRGTRISNSIKGLILAGLFTKLHQHQKPRNTKDILLSWYQNVKVDQLKSQAMIRIMVRQSISEPTFLYRIKSFVQETIKARQIEEQLQSIKEEEKMQSIQEPAQQPKQLVKETPQYKIEDKHQEKNSTNQQPPIPTPMPTPTNSQLQISTSSEQPQPQAPLLLAKKPEPQTCRSPSREFSLPSRHGDRSRTAAEGRLADLERRMKQIFLKTCQLLISRKNLLLKKQSLTCMRKYKARGMKYLGAREYR